MTIKPKLLVIREKHYFKSYRDLIENFWGLDVGDVDCDVDIPTEIILSPFWTEPCFMIDMENEDNDLGADFIRNAILSGKNDFLLSIKQMPDLDPPMLDPIQVLELSDEGGFNTLLVLQKDEEVFQSIVRYYVYELFNREVSFKDFDDKRHEMGLI